MKIAWVLGKLARRDGGHEDPDRFALHEQKAKTRSSLEDAVKALQDDNDVEQLVHQLAAAWKPPAAQ